MAQRQAWWRAVPRPARIGLWSLAAVVLIVVVGGVIFALSFDPDSLKPRVVAAVKQATGRDLTLQGPIRLGLSLQPTLVVQGVSLANPPGFSRPQMATLDELDLKLALLPLLSGRVEIDRLNLVKPDIMLERGPQGQPNWQFDREGKAPASQSAPAGTLREKTPLPISIAEVRVQDGTLTWRDGTTGRTAVLGVPSFRATAASPDANTQLAGNATYNGVTFNLAGQIGPLARLEDATAASPWPVQLTLDTNGAKLAAEGTIAQPLQGRGYTLKLAANVPDVATLQPLLPGRPLPPLHDVALAAQIADTGGKLPEVSSLTLRVGPSDLTQLAALKLDKLEIAAPRLDQPMQITLQGNFGGEPASLTGSLGAAVDLLPGGKPGSPIPLDIALQAAGSDLVVKGSVALGQDGRITLLGDVTSRIIDTGRLATAFRKIPKPAGAGPAPAAPPAPTQPASTRWIIPDTPLPFELLRAANADVKLSIGEIKSGTVSYRNMSARLDLRGGKLNLDPVAIDLPEGRVDAAVTADATQTPQPVTLRVRAPALAMEPLLTAIGEPAYISGTVQVQANVRGAGATPHAIASVLDGTVGLSMANGTVDNRLLGSGLGSILRAVNLLDLVGRGGSSQVQCLAIRLNANHGVAALNPLLLSSSLLTIDGDGSVNLANETLDLRLRPEGRVGPTGVIVPLRLTGSFRSPTTVPDPAAAVVDNAGTVAGVLGNMSPLGIVAGALGGQKLIGGASADCGTALAAARGQSGDAPASKAAAPAPAPSQPAQQPKAPNIGNALKQLFR